MTGPGCGNTHPELDWSCGNPLAYIYSRRLCELMSRFVFFRDMLSILEIPLRVRLAVSWHWLADIPRLFLCAREGQPA
jgi:hypothetical protein